MYIFKEDCLLRVLGYYEYRKHILVIESPDRDVPQTNLHYSKCYIMHSLGFLCDIILDN